MRSSILATLLVSVSLLLSACSSTKLDVPVEDRTGTAAQTDNSRSVNTVTATGPADPLEDQKGVLAKRSIYFDFDSYVVKSEGQPVIEAHAKYLTSHKNRKIVIQGNTDERGGREYNLALGQKRAEAVRKAMTLLGVADSQMEAVSFGKEKPKATGSDEASWAENRRADIVYQ
ncbi:MAG: peptidoglycan-associated lipoprotein Pal [Burkholderiales bacterium]|nr:peptidoglycan-associated lipoprotein Pal [Burkholderiales bacterium]